MRTVKDYFSDTKMIEKIVKRLADMTVGKTLKVWDKKDGNLKFVFSDIEKKDDICDEMLDSMSLVELMSLIKDSRYDPKFEFSMDNKSKTVSSMENSLYYAGALSRFFLSCPHSCVEISTFMQIPVKNYYEYLTSEDRSGFYKGYHRLRAGYRELIQNYKVTPGCETIDTMTIRDLLTVLSRIMCKSWKPAIADPQRYLNDINKAHKLTEMLLIDSLEYKYPEIYNAEEVKSRYCEDYEYEAELPFD